MTQARANAPQTVQARGASRVANANWKAAVAAFLPSVNLGQSAYHSGGANFFQGSLIPTSSGWSYSKGYSLGLTLFDGGSRILGYRAARANLAAADQNEVLQSYAVALNVKQQYFAVLAAREAGAAAQRQLEEGNEQMAVTQAKIAGGAMSRADSLSSAVVVGQAKLAVITAQGSLVSANAALTHLVGSGYEVTAMPSDTGLVPTISLDSTSLVRLALEGPAVRQAEHQVRSGRSSRWVALARYLPSLYVSYGYSRYYASDRFIFGGGSLVNSHALYYSASYSLFDNFQREASVVTANANADNADAQLRDARLLARESLAQYLATFRTAEQTIDLQRLQIESATENVAAKDAQYRAGAVSLVDVLTAETSLAQARQALIQARLDARTAKAQIEAVIGKDIE
ncbi:MAG: TolC family protein [Gemmatimonadaceae bacterium]